MKVSRMSAPCTPGSLAVGFAGPVPIAKLVLALVHGAAALLHRRGDELAQIEQTAARFSREGGRRGAFGLSAGPSGRGYRGRGAESDAERHPEEAADHTRGSRLLLPAARENPLRIPAPTPISFTNGLLTASSTRPESFSTRPTIWVALSSMMSTRSISRLVFSTEVLTSRRRGIVSSRIASIVIFVLSSTRNVLSSTKHRNSTRSTQPTASTIRAMSPPVRARTVMRGLLGPWWTASLPDSPARLIPRGTRPGRPIAHVLAHIGGLVVPVILVVLGPVRLLDPMSRLVVWIDVSLAVPERAGTAVRGVAAAGGPRLGARGSFLRGGGPRLGAERLFLRCRERRVDRVGLRRTRQVDRGRGEFHTTPTPPDSLHR